MPPPATLRVADPPGGGVVMPPPSPLLPLPPLGFGTVKLGRNAKLRYTHPFDLPTEDEAAALLHGVLDLGITLLDTAPAYGLAEARIGRHLAHRRADYTLATKAGETFSDGVSRFDFTGQALRASVECSLRDLRTDHVDILLLHSDGNDLHVLHETDAVATLHALRDGGKARHIGLSGKTVEGARAALAWADVLMVPYNAADREHGPVIAEAHAAGVGVLIKKALASGTLPPADALRFLTEHSAPVTPVVGSLSLAHLAANLAAVRGAAIG